MDNTSLEETEKIILTEDQKSAIEFLRTKAKYKLLKGSAGVGKTFLVAHYCSEYTGQIHLAAPTHKAVKVLREKLQHQVPSSTIHSLLRLDRKLINFEYQFVFDPAANFDHLNNVKLVIVDESSMLDNKLLGWLKEVSINKDFDVIFVGDDKQLNPVGEKDSPVFSQGYPEYELTEILRHQNDIIDLSRNLQWLRQKKTGDAFEWLDTKNLDLSKLVEANGTDKAKFITWTNKIVGAINTAVRNEIYEDPKQFELGETILLNAPFGSDYKNNDEVLIESIEADQIHFEDVPYPYVNILILNKNLIAVDNNSRDNYSRNLEYLKDAAKSKLLSWGLYYKFLESFCQYQYNHAITVHKAQGSTYDYSIVNISEIQRNPNQVERNRMLYTAITRAKEKNYFI